MLHFEISRVAVPRETGLELGGMQLGQSSGALSPWPVQRLRTPLLGCPAEIVRETWMGGSAVQSGNSEGIAWRQADGILFGVIELDEAAFADFPAASALQSASAEAYGRIFRLLEARRMRSLWRIWNYLADINLETHGLERYRQFNIGRQTAFLANQRPATGDVPAACAIGLADGPLSIAFLAGQSPALPIENPRQISAYDYPADYGPRSPTFSRAALAHTATQECLFISGTASILGHRTVHPGEAAAQCRESMANVAAVVAEANRQAKSRPFVLEEFTYRVYVRRAEDFPVVRDTLAELIGKAEVIYVQADICRADLLLEIEAFAAHALEN